jgi:hypothetical protein
LQRQIFTKEWQKWNYFWKLFYFILMQKLWKQKTAFKLSWHSSSGLTLCVVRFNIGFVIFFYYLFNCFTNEMNAYDKYHHQQIIYNKINIFIYTYKSFSDMKIFITHFSSHPTITIERDDDCVNILFAIFVANIFFLL